MADDHASKAISAYEYGINKTPNIDRIADEGIGMVELSLEQAFERAEYHVEKGEVSEARKFYQAILSAVPDNERALTALAALQEGQSLTNVGDPPQEVTTQLVNLYNSGQLVATVEQAQALTDQYPKAFIIWNIAFSKASTASSSFPCSLRVVPRLLNPSA